MTKKNLTIGIIILVAVAILGAGLYLYLTREKFIKIYLSPNPGRFTTGDEVAVTVKSLNQAMALESGKTVIKFDPEYLTFKKIDEKNNILAKENSNNQIHIDIPQEVLNSKTAQDLAVIKFTSIKAGVTDLKFMQDISEFIDEDGGKVAPILENGTYSASTLLTPTVGQTDF